MTACDPVHGPQARVTDDLETLRTDRAAWDAFVERTPTGAYTQLSPWADVKGGNGWRPIRVVADGADGPIGMQLLVRDLRPTPWRFSRICRRR